MRLVARLCATGERLRGSARIGAARLAFRQRWAVLAAAGIYGAIGQQVAALGPDAWDHRVVIGGGREAAPDVAGAFAEALRNRPDEPDAPAPWNRADVLIEARMAGPIPAPPMEPLPE